jgi:hypothetical protein
MGVAKKYSSVSKAIDVWSKALRVTIEAPDPIIQVINCDQ